MRSTGASPVVAFPLRRVSPENKMRAIVDFPNRHAEFLLKPFLHRKGVTEKASLTTLCIILFETIGNIHILVQNANHTDEACKFAEEYVVMTIAHKIGTIHTLLFNRSP